MPTSRPTPSRPGDPAGAVGTDFVADAMPGDAPSGAVARSQLIPAVRRVLRTLSRPAEVTRLTLVVVEEAEALAHADSALLCLSEAEGELLRAQAGSGALGECEGMLLPLEGSFAGQAALSGQAQQTRDLARDPRSFRGREFGLPTGPALAVPLLAPAGSIGALVVSRAGTQDAFGAEDVARLTAFAEVVASAIETTRAHARARHVEAQVEIWRREAELGRWLSRYEATARLDRQAVFEWEPAADRLRWGETFALVFGRAPAASESLAAWLDAVHAPDREQAERALRAAAATTTPLHLELRVVLGDGSLGRVRLRETDRGEWRGAARIVGVAERLPDAPAAEPLDAAAREQEVVRDLVRGIRHEINNPLAVVMGQTQLLQKDPTIQHDPLLAQSLEALYSEALRIQDVLLRLAALEDGYPGEGAWPGGLGPG